MFSMAFEPFWLASPTRSRHPMIGRQPDLWFLTPAHRAPIASALRRNLPDVARWRRQRWAFRSHVKALTLVAHALLADAREALFPLKLQHTAKDVLVGPVATGGTLSINVLPKPILSHDRAWDVVVRRPQVFQDQPIDSPVRQRWAHEPVLSRLQPLLSMLWGVCRPSGWLHHEPFTCAGLGHWSSAVVPRC